MRDGNGGGRGGFRWAAAGLCGLAATAWAQDLAPDPARYRSPASFRVTTTVTNTAVEPFTATIGAIGNALVNASFEPAVYRTRVFPVADAPDRIVLNSAAATHYDSLAEGFFDGAEVRVYRILNGRMELVREDRVPDGGSAMSGWVAVTAEDRLVADKPDAIDASFTYRFDDWNRPDVPYWFTVSAVDATGRESAMAEAVTVTRLSGKPQRPGVMGETVPFKVTPKMADGPSPPAPSSLTGSYDAESGSAVLRWEGVQSDGIAGYRVYRSDYAPEKHRGYFLKLAGGATADSRQHVRKGDWVVIGKRFTHFSRRQHQSYRVWDSHQNKAAMPDGVPFFPDENPARSWVLEPHEPQSPVTEGGATAIRFDLGQGGTVRFDQYNHAGTGQTWYEVLDPAQTYVVEFWARQQGMTNPTVTFKLNGRYGRAVEPMTFTVTDRWQQFRATFRVPDLYEGDGGVGQTSLFFSGPGTVWMDNYRVYSEAAPFLDYLPYEYADLKASGMSCLRTHAFIKTGTSTHDMEQLTNPGGAIGGVGKGNTLPQTLAVMRKAGVQPWLQIEPHMSPAEWRGLIEYLAAPYDPATDTPAAKPWAAKRWRQGRPQPWSEEFPRIFFEIGNETWNWLFSPWVFEAMTDSATKTTYNRGEVYGLFQEHVIDCLKSSPWWQPAGLDAKVRFVLGGWEVQEYGLKAAPRSPRSHYVTRAGYNGGWDEGEGPAEGNDPSLFRALIQAGQTALPGAARMRSRRAELVAVGVGRFELGTYEAGPGYALSGLNKQARMSPAQVRAQEETMKSLAAGTATLDTFLGRAENDFDIQNFFTYFHGRTHWVSHTAWHRGHLAHPCWMTLALFNTEASGDMLAVDRLGGPLIDLPRYGRRPAVANVPLAACYATRRGDRLAVFVLSRKLDGFPLAGDDGFTPVTIELPIRSARSVRLLRMSGDPRSHNLDGEKVRIERIDLPAAVATPRFLINAATGGDDRGLPPAATFLYLLDGVR